jgi:hypothetical protein
MAKKDDMAKKDGGIVISSDKQEEQKLLAHSVCLAMKLKMGLFVRRPECCKCIP